jgi:hypothetical protein
VITEAEVARIFDSSNFKQMRGIVDSVLKGGTGTAHGQSQDLTTKNTKNTKNTKF